MIRGVVDCGALMEATTVKEKGNQFFKDKDYVQAAACYTEALQLSSAVVDGEPKERCIYFKNRAACFLKMKEYEKALEDCVSALSLVSSDTKALYRYAQALEGMGKEAESLVQLKKLLSIDPRNKEANEMARRLMVSLKKQSEQFHSTNSLVEEMYKTLSDPQAPLERRVQSAKNMAILSREEGGAQQLFQAGGVARLIPYLESDSPDLVNHVLQVFVGLSIGNKSRATSVLEILTLEKLSTYLSSTRINIGMSAVTILKEILLSTIATKQPVKDQSNAKDTAEDENESVTKQQLDTPFILPLIQFIFLSLASYDILGDTRDGILELFVKTIPHSNMASLYVKEKLVEHVLQVASHTWQDMEELQKDKEIVRLPVSADCRMNVSMVLSSLYERIRGKDEKDLRDLFKQQCSTFILLHAQQSDLLSQLGTMASLAALLQGVVEVGNEIISKEESILKLAVSLATSSTISSQAVAVEAIALAASDKSRCQEIMTQGLPALKELYHSSDDRIQVRALVGLCKLGSSGGSNVNAKPFSDGANVKLEKTCRQFLVSSKKEDNLKKWAAEGIAFLSLDAEVKEALIQDKPALQVLFKLAESSDKSLLYGIASIFVNLTNSYDKPERNPELEELGKFAGENIPKEHEFDGPDYVKNRVDTLLKAGIIQALSGLIVCNSKAIREQVARVFLALTVEVSNRGPVIQQGGVKNLILLASENSEKGQHIASQALAKIGITNNPQLAFPGQRAIEVVRPLVRLLKSENGLQQFEGLMALTNLASLSDEIRQHIYREGAIPIMEGLMFEEQELIRRASTEALCNMIQLEEVHKRFYGDDLERVKLWTLFSGEEDVGLARAASGGLAQLSHDPKLCSKIMEVKSSLEILKELVTNENQELQYRGMYIIANLIEASQDIAAKLLEGELLDILMAYLQGDFPPNVKNQVERGLKKAVEYGLIMPNPDIHESTTS